MNTIDERKRWTAGFDAAINVLKDAPTELAPMIDALLRIQPDEDDDPMYDTGFRSALDAYRSLQETP